MLIGFSRSGKRPVSRGAVVLLDVLARAGDGQQVEQLEVVEAEHLDQPRRRALGVLQVEPAVELQSAPGAWCFDAGDAVVEQAPCRRPR